MQMIEIQYKSEGDLLAKEKIAWMEIFYTKPGGQAAALAEAQTFVGSA